MTLKIEEYTRKSFNVQAVEVTEENIKEVAKWCGGRVLHIRKALEEGGDPINVPYIKVATHNPVNDRQSKAFIGDRVLKSSSGFKVYTPKAFENSFFKKDRHSSKEALTHLQDAVDKPVVAKLAGKKVKLTSEDGPVEELRVIDEPSE